MCDMVGGYMGDNECDEWYSGPEGSEEEEQWTEEEWVEWEEAQICMIKNGDDERMQDQEQGQLVAPNKEMYPSPLYP